MTVAEKIKDPTEPSGGGALAVLKGRFSIDVSRRLSEFENSGNMVVKATDLQDPEAEHFAVIIGPYSIFRHSLALLMGDSHIPGMVDLVSHGKVRFSDTDMSHVAVFEKPRGGPLYREGGQTFDELFLLNTVLPTLAHCLRKLHSSGQTHRAIRADNLFFTDETHSEILLGEAISSAPGATQPVVYEPVESALAHPMGRGDGTPAHDLYAVGVLILHLLGGKLPASDLSADEIYRKKLEIGSFAALAEDIPMSARMSDVLAGLLHDDPKIRWNADTLINWRETIAQTSRRGRGEQPAFGKIIFQSEEFNSPRLLAHALLKNPKAALELIESGKIAKWTKGALRDEATAARIEQVQSSASASRGDRHYDTAAVTQVVRLLDPEGAFWYRDVCFCRGAFGPLILWAFQNDDTGMKKTLTELLESSLIQNISVEEMRASKELRMEWVSDSLLSKCYDYMKQKRNLGFGLERCLYEINIKSPCLSPIVLGSHVRSVPEFIEIAEKKLASSNGQGNPLDRHAAAFIAAKTKGLDRLLKKLAAKDPDTATHALGQIKIFAKLQGGAQSGPLPGFCQWAEDTLKPVFAKIRSRLRREVVTQKFKEAKKSGYLSHILNETDMERQIEIDAREYENALAAATESARIAGYLETMGEQRRFEAERYGSWITSVLAITSLVTSMVLSSLYFLG